MFYLYFIIVAVVAFFAAVFGYLKTVNFFAAKFPSFNPENAVFAVPLVVGAPLLFLLREFAKGEKDWLFYPANSLMLAVFAGAFLIGLCSLSRKTNLFSPLVLLLCAAVCGFLLPNDVEFYGLELGLYLKKAAIVVLWCLVALGFAVLAKTDGLLSAYSMIFAAVQVVFYAISGTSAMQMLFSSVLFGISGAYLLFNWSPAQIKMNFSSSLSFGFFFGFIVLVGSAEEMWLSEQILLSYLYIVTGLYLLQKISFANRRDENMILCLKVMSVLAVLAVVQCYLEVAGASFIVAVLLVFWIKGKSVDAERKSFAQTNREALKNIKEGFEILRKYLGDK